MPSYIEFLRASPLAFSCLVRAYTHPSGGNRGGKNWFFGLMISSSTIGTTRRVLVVGPWVIKLARGARGRRCNLYEANLFRTTTAGGQCSAQCERVFNPDRKDHHWGRRKLKRDQ
jgi:hypothetical protein